MDDKATRIKNLNDIKECLIDAYGNEPKFKADLDEILAAIDKRLDLIEGFTR